jgi:hypothetical protein
MARHGQPHCRFGETAYSVLLKLRSGSTGLLYEWGSIVDHYHNITFARLSTQERATTAENPKESQADVQFIICTSR